MNNRDVYNTEFGILVMSGLLITDGSQHKGLGPIAQENDFIFSLAEAINYDTRTNSKIKYIIILGDVAYGARSKEYQVATDIIAELCEELNVARENVIIVPGNHDINRVDSEISCALKNLDEKELIEHQGTKFEKFTAFYNSFYDGFTTVESFNPEKAIFRTVLDKEMNSVFLGINTNFKESQIDHAGMIPYDRLSEELRIIRREYPNENFIALMHHGPSFGKLNKSIENGESLLRLFKANGVNTFIFSKAKNLVGISTSDNTYYLRCGSVYSTIISIPTNMMLLENKKNGKENALFVNYYEYVSQGKYWKVQSMGTGESGRIVLEPRMRDQEIYYLLKKIDDGYDATEYETSMLKSVKSIAWNNIDTLPNCINLLTAVTELDLRNSNVSDIGALSGMEALTCLILKRTEVSDISVLQGLKALTTLNLNETRVSDISALRGLKELTELYIGGTRITDIRTISRLTALRSLSLSGAKVSDISALEGLEKLTALNIRETKVSDISSLSGLKSLTYLNLIGTNVSDISALRGLHALSSLYLRKTNVSDISALKELKELKELDLRYLNLDAIPEWILDLQLDFIWGKKNAKRGIHIDGLKLKDQPIEIFSQSRDLILAYYESQERAPINECKVIFLGDGGVGKSLIIDRLMKNGEPSPDFDGVSTPGIRITSKEYQIKGDKIELHFWDFGGQAIMHSMHRLFLTNRTLYVVVTNARDNKANEQAWYWIRNIKSFAKGAPVLLLINQKDQNPSANINETGLRKEYPQIKGVSIVSAKEDTTEEFNKLIREEICRIVSEMESVHTLFPKSWHLLMDDLQEMKTDYIDSKEFLEKCRDKGIDIQQDTLDRIICWYQDLGVCFYSRKHPVERRYMVLKPKWLLNALYILSFNGRKYAKNGIIKEEDIYKLICEPVPDEDIKKVWSDISYESDEIQYIINVLLNFNLVYRIDNEQFFVPMLCDENEPTVIDDFETEDAIHVSFKYEYLPENVLHRLMVLHGFELNRDLVWKTGAVLERKRLGWHALARSKDNCIDVYAKASDQKTHPINSYLDIIRESVYRINSDFGLAAKEYITYAKDGKTDEFEYQLLEESKNAGLNEVYSRVFKARITIDEIIGVIKSPNLLQSDIEYIYECVMSACKQIQARKIYWNKPNHMVSEDDRNDGMRDLISSRGLFVRDQTHAGRGQEGKNPGEVDLMVMKTSTDVQALIEAMVLSSVNTKYIKEHMDKLVDGYNDSGFRDLFLVSYVELERSKFSSFWKRYKNKVKELGTGNFTVNTEIAPEEDESLAWIKSIKITYDYAGEDIRVYHICARVAE